MSLEKTVVHIIGAASSKCHCLSELHKKIGGATLIFSYENLLESENNLSEHCLNWIREEVQGHDLILTCGLPLKTAKSWIKKAYPDAKIKHVIWEVHHEKTSESKIVEERSWAFLLNGILSQGKRALEKGIPSDHELIKHTPLSTAMKYLKSNKEDVVFFVKSLAKQQESENFIHLENALICSEAFAPSIRSNSILKISKQIGSSL